MLAMANQPDERPATGPTEEPAGPAPFTHTRWQNFIRDMWLVLGPAQTGLPPYATPQEREAWRLATLPQRPAAERKSTPPPGYQITEYKDSQGYVHRSLVPITSPAAAMNRPEPRQADGQPVDNSYDSAVFRTH